MVHSKKSLLCVFPLILLTKILYILFLNQQKHNPKLCDPKHICALEGDILVCQAVSSIWSHKEETLVAWSRGFIVKNQGR